MPGLKSTRLSPSPYLGQASQFLWPVLFHDASNMHFLRSHDSQLAGMAASELAAYPHSRPLHRLMSSRYCGASAIGAHITGEGLHLTSMTQLSRHCCLAVHPPHGCGFGRTGRANATVLYHVMGENGPLRDLKARSKQRRQRFFPVQNVVCSDRYSTK